MTPPNWRDEDGIPLLQKTGATFIGIFELALHCGANGIEKVSGMNKGGSQKVEGVEFRMVHAVHSAGTSGAGSETNFPSDPCGYVLTFEDGFRIYFAGDTNVFADMALIGELYEPDLAMLPIGDFFTMGALEAAKAVELLGVKRVLGMHYGTFDALVGTPQALRDELGKRGLSDVVVEELAPGDTLE